MEHLTAKLTVMEVEYKVLSSLQKQLQAKSVMVCSCCCSVLIQLKFVFANSSFLHLGLYLNGAWNKFNCYLFNVVLLFIFYFWNACLLVSLLSILECELLILKKYCEQLYSFIFICYYFKVLYH